jgi:histidinol-phosphate/aromatic aminotransferase/cobyric acid decarboxylase-like protein
MGKADIMRNGTSSIATSLSDSGSANADSSMSVGHALSVSVSSVAHYASDKDPGRLNFLLAINPLGPGYKTEELFPIVAAEHGYRRGQYPVNLKDALLAKLKKFYGTDRGKDIFDPGMMRPDIYVGGGAAGVLHDIFQVGCLSEWFRPGQFLVVPSATFPVPAGYALQHQMNVRRVPLASGLDIDFEQMRRAVQTLHADNFDAKMIFLANPNNPTGLMASTESIINLAHRCRATKTIVVVSEANIECVPVGKLRKSGGSLLDPHNLFRLPANLLVVRSFSKAHGLAHARVGYVVGDSKIIANLNDRAAPFSVPADSAICAMIALEDADHLARSREHMARETRRIATGLRRFGFPFVSNSDSNVLVAKVPDWFSSSNPEVTTSDALAALLRQHDISVTSLTQEFGHELAGKYIRIAPSTREDNEEFLSILGTLSAQHERAYMKQHATTLLPSFGIESLFALSEMKPRSRESRKTVRHDARVGRGAEAAHG